MSAPAARPNPGVVMVIDDDPVARAFVRHALEGAPLTLLEAGGWAEASPVLLDREIDVILLDVGLPGITGDALAPMIRDLVPVSPALIFFSGLEEADLQELCRSSGARAYFRKGGKPEALGLLVAGALAAQRGARDRQEPEGPDGPRQLTEEVMATPFEPPAPPPEVSPLDWPSRLPGLDGIDREGWWPRTLVVDDSATRRTLLCDWLAGMGFPVSEAADSRQALSAVISVRREARPELIVSDVSMPGLDGIELTVALRRHDSLDRIPVVLYSVSPEVVTRPETELAAMQAGASEYLRGPVAFDALPSAIARRLKTLLLLRRLARYRTL